MNEAQSPSRSGLVVAILGLYALVGGLTSVIGWPANVPWLTDWGRTGISIQPNATVAAMCSGAALILLSRGHRRLTAALGIVVGLIGASTLFQYLTGINLDALNTLLMFGREWGRVGVIHPGRMGPPGSMCWTLVGTALLLASRGAGPARRSAPSIALLPFAIATLSITGYVFEVDRLFSLPYLTVIAFQTATFIGAVSAAVVMAVPEHAPARWLLDRGATGAVARRAVPFIFLVPLIVGWLVLQGQLSVLYDTRFGVAIFVVVLISLMLALLWWNLATISRHEVALLESERRIREDVAERKRVAQQLDAELAATTRLQALSTQLVPSGDVSSLLREILSAATDLMGTSKGNIRFHDPADGSLRIVVHQGFGPEFLEHFADRKATPLSNPAAGASERVIWQDILQEPTLQGTEDLRVLLGDGIRAIQSTPLVSRDGRLLGSLDSHFGVPHRPAERSLHYLDLLARMAADFIERSQADQALRDADRRKNQFLAMLAHELRNPLAPIRNSVELLRIKGGDTQVVESVSAMMERQVGQMVRLVDDLLDVSRITWGKIELRKQRVELAPILVRAVESARSLVESSGHELRVEVPQEPIYIDADAVRLTQVVDNLLNNACKFTDRGGRLLLRAEREPEQAVIRVRDNGIGIDADQLTTIFDMFTQVDASLERSVSGLGIGLTLVRNLAQMHGWTVEATSEGLGRGSEFVVRMPIAAELHPAPPASLSKTEGTSLTRRRILIVDDNEDGAASLAMLLQTIGHRVHIAGDGLAGVEAAERFRPDVVLLDIGLPKLNGYEACRRIKGAAWGKDLLVVAVTGWGQEEDRSRSREAGFDAHLVKPVDLDALLKLIASAQSDPVAARGSIR